MSMSTVVLETVLVCGMKLMFTVTDPEMLAPENIQAVAVANPAKSTLGPDCATLLSTAYCPFFRPHYKGRHRWIPRSYKGRRMHGLHRGTYWSWIKWCNSSNTGVTPPLLACGYLGHFFLLLPGRNCIV